MRKIFEFSIKQPLFVNLLTLFIVIAGLISYERLNRDVFPNVQFDLVLVTTRYPGASPEDIEKNITTPIEKELKRVNYIEKLYSFSSENQSLIIVNIDPDAPDVNKVINDVQRAVDNTDDLPNDLDDKPLVNNLDSSFRPIVEVSLSGNINEFELTRHAKNIETLFYLEPEIASVSRQAWRDEEIWVEIKPEEMSKYYLSLFDLIQALQNQNVVIPGGNIIINGKEVVLKTNGEIINVESAKDVAVRGNDSGENLKLGMIADVEREFAPEDVIQRTNGSQSINLIVSKREKSDAVELVSKIKAICDDYKKSNPEINISYVNDYSYYVERRLNVLKSNGLLGVILVLTIIFAFMSFRSALVTALGIPVAFLATLFVMDMTGMTINLITMFGLIIVLGMLVDDGIVVAENVFTLREQGYSPEEAAIEGTYRVWKPVLSAVLTTIAAFSPLMLMTGLIGKFIKYIPYVVCIALIASLIEAFLVLPSHLAEIEKLRKSKWGFKREWQNRLKLRYKNFVTYLIGHRYKVLGGFLVLFVGSVITFTSLPLILFPKRGIETFYVRARAPIGTPIEKTAQLFEPIEKIISELPKKEVQDFVMIAGQTGDGQGDPEGDNQANVGQIAVYLTPINERKRDTDAIENEVREKIKNIKGFDEIKFDTVNSGPPVGKAVEINVSGQNLNQLKSISDKIIAFLNSRKGVKDIASDLRDGKDEIVIEVNQAMAAKAGVSAKDIGLAVRSAFEGIRATSIKKGDEEIYIRVRMPESYKESYESFMKLLIPTKTGYLVELNKVAKIKTGKSYLRLRHYQRQRSVLVSANVDEAVTNSVDENNAVIKAFKGEASKLGISITLGGEWEETSKSVDNLKVALIEALIIIFIILAFQFKSVIQPLIVLVALPYGLIGVTIAFVAHMEPKSFLALVGGVGLAGVVVNDSIVMIDFMNEKMKDAKDRIEAISEAASMRLRAVMLTTITTVVGLMPTAYGILGYDPFLKPMALTLSWGLLIASTLTLIVTPCIYASVDDWRILWKRKTEKFFKKEMV